MSGCKTRRDLDERCTDLPNWRGVHVGCGKHITPEFVSIHGGHGICVTLHSLGSVFRTLVQAVASRCFGAEVLSVRLSVVRAGCDSFRNR